MNNSLAEVHPELVSEWSEKNLLLTPDDITFGSNKKVWWKGACSHEWQTSVKARSSGEKCPICSGARVIVGINDLATLEPLLVKQWSKKNKIKPTEVSIGSHKKVIWRCEKGHEWEAAVKSRTINKTGCPYCSHNKVLAGFNDLATLQPDIAAEWSDRNYPLLPTQVTVFANRKAWWRCKDCGREWNTLISTRSGGSKCPYCSGYIFLKGFNDLQTTHPEIASEWSEKNLPLKPDEVNAKSRKNIWWKCRKCGNEWKSVINARVKGTVFLREPQFEALEMYVFVKEFMDNAHMYQMFDEWRKRENRFSDASYYTIHKGGQGTLLDMGDEQNEIVFKQMKKYKEDYPNYIYALTMGLGKTILMATCIFYEFLLAKKYPKDKRFCHNALVFAPDKTVLESLREIMTFDKTKVVPPEYAHVLDQNIKFHFLEGTGITLHTIDDSDFNIVISNNQKIIVKKKRKEDTPSDILFGSGSLLADIYGNDDDDSDVWDDASLIENQRFKKLCRLPQLGVYVDEAHHLFGANLEKELRSGGANKTTLRNTINMLAANAVKAITQQSVLFFVPIQMMILPVILLCTAMNNYLLPSTNYTCRQKKN